MKFKRFISMCIFVATTFSCFGINSVMAQSNNIKIGDYVTLGKYQGKDILWRCVDIDENGPLMLSDKVLCVKPYDAAGTNKVGSHEKGYDFGTFRKEEGSNYWNDSNIHDWLNSSAENGNVIWKCGNPPNESNVFNGLNRYHQEAGFLNQFTNKERSLIKNVKQKQILDGYEEYAMSDLNDESDSAYTIDQINRTVSLSAIRKQDLKDIQRYFKINSNAHKWNFDINNVLQNYDTAYSNESNDKVFLLDVKQLYNVYNNGEVLGKDYYKAKPTKVAVNKSSYKSVGVSADSYCSYWLRTPYTQNLHSSSVRIVNSVGNVSKSLAYYGYDIGVRPAFYINSVNFDSGDGTENNPYKILN